MEKMIAMMGLMKMTNYVVSINLILRTTGIILKCYISKFKLVTLTFTVSNFEPIA